MPPNTEDLTKKVEGLTKEVEDLNLKELIRENGYYAVFPQVYYPPLEEYEHTDPGKLADPTKASIYSAATKVFDVTPNIGTEIHGIQLSKLTEQQKNDIALLVAERGVLFFRDQDLTPRQGIELGRHYGPLHIHNFGGHPPGLPEVLTIQRNPNAEKGTATTEGSADIDDWHTDVSFEKQPPSVTFLKMDTLPEVGGDTVWGSGYAAYDRLSPAWQKFVEGLEAVHSGDGHRANAKRTGIPLRREAPDNVHPVVRTHPLTGWKSLYVDPGFTRSIVGFSRRESNAVLNFLYSHIESGADFQVRFKWTEDTIALWDNRVTYHRAVTDFLGLGLGLRHGFRITATAEIPYFDPHSKSRQRDLTEKKEKAQ